MATATALQKVTPDQPLPEARPAIEAAISVRPDRKGTRRILNCIPSRETERDWPAESAFATGLAAAAAAIPSSVDLREEWWKIGDQGATGSCVGWATADSVVRWHFVKKHLLKQTELLSVRYVWMGSKETDEFTNRPTTFIEQDGTSLKAAVHLCRRYGVVLESELGFDSGKLYQGGGTTFYSKASVRRIASYYGLTTRAFLKIQAWRKWIANVGPILTRLNIDDTFLHAGTDGFLDKYKASTAGGGHAVAIVGYTPKTFIVRNSWGTSWGDKGFAYASPKYFMAAFTEGYGVVV